jgi:hypothetical protein
MGNPFTPQDAGIVERAMMEFHEYSNAYLSDEA